MKTVLSLLALSTVLASASAFAASGDSFTCTAVPSDPRAGETFTLKIESRDKVSVDGSVADLDDKYDPRLNSGYLRFEYENSDEGTTEVLVQRGLVYLADKGFIKIQNRGEGFESDKYACVRK
jgi:hypothetical protein